MFLNLSKVCFQARNTYFVDDNDDDDDDDELFLWYGWRTKGV